MPKNYLKPLGLGATLLLALAFFGCALGVDRVKLFDPLKYSPGQDETKLAQADVPGAKSIPNDKIKIVINKIKDNRPDITCLGTKRNGYGMKMGKVDVEEGVIFIE